MTSVQRIYRSTDTSAPTLSGTAGSLIALLNACLVNGYGSMTAAGWTLAYSGTNQAVFSPGSGGSGASIYINDAGPGAGTYKEARACGFQTVSGLGTGTLQFPNSSSAPITGGYDAIRKSTTADSTARAWTLIADQYRFHLLCEAGDQPVTNIQTAFPFFFGDILPYGSTDQWYGLIAGRNIENNATGQYEGYGVCDWGAGNAVPSGYAAPGNYMPSNWNGVGSAQWVGKYSNLSMIYGNQSSLNSPASSATASVTSTSVASGYNYTPASFAYPNSPDVSGWFEKVLITQSGIVRGVMPGLLSILHNAPFNHNDVISPTAGDYAGKTFLVQNIPLYANTSNARISQIAIDISGSWTL